jgi:hypothetical protein
MVAYKTRNVRINRNDVRGYIMKIKSPNLEDIKNEEVEK